MNELNKAVKKNKTGEKPGFELKGQYILLGTCVIIRQPNHLDEQPV
jgi:hypothetical protein